MEEEGSLNQFWISWKAPEAKQAYNGTQAVQTNLMRSLMHIKGSFIWPMAVEIASSNSISYFRLCGAQVEIELRVSLRSCG